jgi:hypothetical protein
MRGLCWNGLVKLAVAWVTLVLAGILGLALFLILVDLVSTKITSGSIYAYADMALALVLFCGSANVVLRSFRLIRPQRHRIEATHLP